MKIREFLALFEGRNPESELRGVLLPFANDLTVIGVANRGEFADMLAEPTQPVNAKPDEPPETLPTGCRMPEQGEPLPEGCKWDDTFIIMEDEPVPAPAKPGREEMI